MKIRQARKIVRRVRLWFVKNTLTAAPRYKLPTMSEAAMKVAVRQYDRYVLAVAAYSVLENQ